MAQFDPKVLMNALAGQLGDSAERCYRVYFWLGTRIVRTVSVYSRTPGNGQYFLLREVIKPSQGLGYHRRHGDSGIPVSRELQGDYGIELPPATLRKLGHSSLHGINFARWKVSRAS